MVPTRDDETQFYAEVSVPEMVGLNPVLRFAYAYTKGLDVEVESFEDFDGGFRIVGNDGASYILRRLTSEEAARMPQEDS